MNHDLVSVAGHCRPLPRKIRRQRGQALVESLVIGLLLVPLVILAILLGKYQSIQAAGIAASRSLAFECTVRQDECSKPDGLQKLTEELAQRHLSRAGREIFSQDGVPNLRQGAERHALWTNRKGEGLLEQFSDISANVTPGSFDAGLGAARGLQSTGQISNAVALISSLAGPDKFGLGLRDGLLTATVQVNTGTSHPALNGGARWLDGFPLQFNSKAAILVDDWSASRPQGSETNTVESRVNQGKQLASALESAQDLGYLAIRASIALMSALNLEQTAGSFKYHDVDMDIIPPDRRGIVSAQPVDRSVYSGW